MRAFRLLLLFYPRQFRRRFGPEMTEAFEFLLLRTRAERGAAGVAGLWVRLAVDAMLSGSAERLYGSIPHVERDGPMRRMQFHFRQAFRSLRRAPAYTAAFVVTLDWRSA